MLQAGFLCFKVKVTYPDFKSEFVLTGIKSIIFWGTEGFTGLN